MADAFSFKLGARLPNREITLSGNGLATVTAGGTGLTGISPIKFVYRRIGVDERNEITATVTDSDNLKIRVDFGAVDVDEVAKYQWHVEAYVGALFMCFPEKGFYTFSVTDTIDGV